MLKKIKSWIGLDFFVSELDQFLERFRAKHPVLSPAQRAERDKSMRIDKMRDVAETDR
ncbi:MAG: hypothetical protein ACD_45C00192G0002 [uncultured bacterium]|nr:MAG: hypothetical protein ACD_45C00192G0002 [uncultured bacterium]